MASCKCAKRLAVCTSILFLHMIIIYMHFSKVECNKCVLVLPLLYVSVQMCVVCACVYEYMMRVIK